MAGSWPEKRSVCDHVGLGMSTYYLHVVRWFSVFPQSQILLIRTEDLSAHPSTTMNQVWSFIDVYESSHQIKEKINRNAWIDDSKYSKYFKMWPETRKILWEFFKPYNNCNNSRTNYVIYYYYYIVSLVVCDVILISAR